MENIFDKLNESKIDVNGQEIRYQKAVDFLKENADKIDPMILNSQDVLFSFLTSSVKNQQFILLDNGSITITGYEQFLNNNNEEVKSVCSNNLSVYKKIEGKTFIKWDNSISSAKNNPNMINSITADRYYYTSLYNLAGIEVTRASATKKSDFYGKFDGVDKSVLLGDLSINKRELNFTRFGYDHRGYDTIINRYRWEESLGFYSFRAKSKNQDYGGLVEMSGHYPASLPNTENIDVYIKLSEPFKNMDKEEYVKYEDALLTKEFNANFIKESLEDEYTILTPTAREYFENLLNELESSRKQ